MRLYAPEYTQQLGLNVQWQLTYLIEKQRAVVRFLKIPGWSLMAPVNEPFM